MGLSVDPIGFVPEMFTAIDPLMAQNVRVSAVSFKSSFGFHGSVCLIGNFVVWDRLSVLMFCMVVEDLVLWLHTRGAREQLSVLATALNKRLYFFDSRIVLACHGKIILNLDRELGEPKGLGNVACSFPVCLFSCFLKFVKKSVNDFVLESYLLSSNLYFDTSWSSSLAYYLLKANRNLSVSSRC